MINKLRRRFILIAMASVTSVMVLLSLSINAINFISTNSSLNNMLLAIYDNQGLVPEFQADPRPDEKPPRDIPLTPETPYSTRYFVLRFDADGRLFDADMRHIAAVTAEDAETYLAIALKHKAGFGYSGGYKFYVASTDSGQYMAIFLDCQQELRSVRLFAMVSLLVMVSGLVLVYILIIFFSKRAIDPVVKNAEKQKQFITDASHELKTPLTVMTTSLKVLEMEVGQQKWIDKTQGQVDRMRDLVNDLITLSRLDEEKPAFQVAEFDISEVVSETAESFRDFAAAQGHPLELEIVPGLRCRGNEYAVRQMVSVLLDNAVKYADHGGRITLRLEAAKKGVVLRVSNPCAELEPEKLDALFDRFYRPDSSRSKQTGGFGIGLSIARSVAEAHKGSIQAECLAEGVVQFTAVLRQ